MRKRKRGLIYIIRYIEESEAGGNGFNVMTWGSMF